MNNVTRKLDTRRASAMLARSPHQPYRTRRPFASDWSEMETKRLNLSCSKKDHEDGIIESQRIRTTKSTDKNLKDHIADRGRVSMSHNKRQGLKTLPKTTAWHESKVNSHAEVILRTKLKG